MEVEKGKKIHSVLSTIFYYTFVLIIIAVFVLSLVIEEITLLNNILFIFLIVSSIVIVFYLTVQMLRYNLTVNKKIQAGIFFVVIGFLLILLSTSKQLSFIESLDLDFLGYDFFVYWGIGSVVFGIFVELTFLDQFIWKLFVQPIKYLWKLTAKFAKWVRKNWLNIILYTLDLASLAGIIYVAIFWSTDWWKITVLSVSCVYPLVHHHKRIWKAIKFIVIDIIYEFFKKVGEFIKQVCTSIWNAIVSFVNLVLKHWLSILKEILRLMGAAGGGVMIYFGATLVEYRFLIGLGIIAIVVSLLFTRKTILTMLWDLLSSIASFFWDKLISFMKTILEKWWPIFKEFLRLVGAAGGVYLIYHGYVFDQFSYFIGIGVALILISLIFTRKAVLVWLGNGISKFCTYIWEEILKPYYARIINEIIRLIFVGGGIYLIYLGVIKQIYYYCIYIGIAIILLVEIITRKAVLKKIYSVMKNIALAFWDLLVWLTKPFRFLWEKLVAVTKFLIKNWFKVVLYLLDLVAIAAIIYLSITWNSEWWYIILLFISCCYIPAHHYKLVWKSIKFIGINIFYDPFIRFVNLIADFFKALWNGLVDIAKFLKEHWWTISKEILRLIGATGGITLIVYSFILEDFSYLAWIGITVVLVSEILSRKIVLKKIYEFFKAIFVFIFENRVIISRVLGFLAALAGVIIHFVLDYFITFILLVSIGGTFVLFAHFIYHPKKLWEFLVSIPKTLHKILVTIWLTIKTGSVYIYQNGIRLILLIVMIFTFIYGLFVVFNFDFIGIFENISAAIRISLGALFVVVAVVAFILLRRELKKLRTGSSKVLAQQIRERWKQ